MWSWPNILRTAATYHIPNKPIFQSCQKPGSYIRNYALLHQCITCAYPVALPLLPIKVPVKWSIVKNEDLLIILCRFGWDVELRDCACNWFAWAVQSFCVLLATWSLSQQLYMHSNIISSQKTLQMRSMGSTHSGAPVHTACGIHWLKECRVSGTKIHMLYMLHLSTATTIICNTRVTKKTCFIMTHLVFFTVCAFLD